MAMGRLAASIMGLIITVIIWSRWGILGEFCWAFMAGVGYRILCVTHPRHNHGPCNGTGRIYNRFFNWMFRMCGCGNGRVVRAGAARYGQPRIRAEAAQDRANIRATRRFSERP
jgi:hypothetical protein